MATIPASDQILARLKALHPRVIDLALDRIRALLARLGDPQDHLPPVIHVAGTNGKGSTLAYLRAMARAGGLRSHVYISPHLVRFSERITLADQEIDEAALAALLQECEDRNGGQPITFFEITTAAAFLAFARTPADLCLLETGMGGRFDATNVVSRPALTLITSISLDHQAFLGDSLAAIAGEKAGIIKPEIPCLTVRHPPEVMAVLRRQAERLNSPLLVEGEDWSVEPGADGLILHHAGDAHPLPWPALPGRHQWQNAGLAAAAARLLPLRLNLADGLRQAWWPARLQKLSSGPLCDILPSGWELWLDGGHNPGAGQVLADHLRQYWQDRPVLLVVGMLNSKDSHGFVDPLLPLISLGAAIAIPGEANSLSAEAMAQSAGPPIAPYASLEDSVRSLVKSASRPGRILICGSLYLAGRVLEQHR